MRGIKYYYNFETQESMRRQNYTRNGWGRWENYTRNEWGRCRPCDDVITDDQFEVLQETGLLNTVLDPPQTRLPGGQNTSNIDRVEKLHSERVEKM